VIKSKCHLWSTPNVNNLLFVNRLQTKVYSKYLENGNTYDFCLKKLYNNIFCQSCVVFDSRVTLKSRGGLKDNSNFVCTTETNVHTLPFSCKPCTFVRVPFSYSSGLRGSPYVWNFGLNLIKHLGVTCALTWVLIWELIWKLIWALI